MLRNTCGQKLEYINNFYCSFLVKNFIELRSAVFEFLHATRQASNNGRANTCVVLKFNCELTKKRR